MKWHPPGYACIPGLLGLISSHHQSLYRPCAGSQGFDHFNEVRFKLKEFLDLIQEAIIYRVESFGLINEDVCAPHTARVAVGNVSKTYPLAPSWSNMTEKLLLLKPSYLPSPMTKISSVFCYGQNISPTFSNMIASQLPVTETRPEQTECQPVVKCWKNLCTPSCKKKRSKKSEKYWCSAHYLIIDS